VILDTSVLIALLTHESDYRQYVEAMESASVLRLSAGSYLELGVVLQRTQRSDLIPNSDAFLEATGVVIEPVTVEQALIARQAYRDFGKGSGHPAGLNYGDCFSYALAKDKREPILFKGDDFRHTDLRPAV
jgi:ribonuclease VapC